MSRVTIKSIAKDLGISHMTVSRALSDNPNVQQETREAIKKRARELGYVKSAAAMAMRGDGTRIVGLLLPNIVNEYYARFANAMALCCDEHSLQLIIHLTNDSLEAEEQAIARLREVQATSVVMVPAPGTPKSPLSDPGPMRVIELIRQRDPDENVLAVLVEDANAIKAAFRYLARSGHTKIAYIGADETLSSGRNRLSAFLEGVTEAGTGRSNVVVRTGAPSFGMGRDNAREILLAGAASALICGGFEISNGALSALMDKKLLNNSDIAFIGYGDPSFYTWLNGGISTIQVPLNELAEHAVKLILAPDLQVEETQVSFPAEFIIR